MTDKPERKDYPPYLDCPRPRVPMTNGDKIRAMTDEELVWVVAYGICPNNDGECSRRGCEHCVREWLKQEVKE